MDGSKTLLVFLERFLTYKQGMRKQNINKLHLCTLKASISLQSYSRVNGIVVITL